MIVQTFNEIAGESDCETAVALAITDPGVETDETWLDAALDWDELDGERIVPLVSQRRRPPLVVA